MLWASRRIRPEPPRLKRRTRPTNTEQKRRSGRSSARLPSPRPTVSCARIESRFRLHKPQIFSAAPAPRGRFQYWLSLQLQFFLKKISVRFAESEDQRYKIDSLYLLWLISALFNPLFRESNVCIPSLLSVRLNHKFTSHLDGSILALGFRGLCVVGYLDGNCSV